MRVYFKTGYDHDIRLFPDARQALRYAALLAVAVALPLLLDDFLIGEATNVLIWAIAGMGLMVLTGHAGQPSLGHAAFLAAGCYAHAILMGRFGLPFPVSFALAGIVTGLLGVLIAIPVLRLHGIYLAIATLALSILTEDIIVLAEPWTGGVVGLTAPAISIAGVEFDRIGSPGLFYWLCLAVAVLVTLGYCNILRAPLGRAFLAVRDSEISAQAMGVNLARTKAAAFGHSCMATGWAGALMGHFFYTFNHEVFTVAISIQLLLMIVNGGLGSIHGAYYGAVDGRDHPAGDQHRARRDRPGPRRRGRCDPRTRGRHIRADPDIRDPVRTARNPRADRQVADLFRAVPVLPPRHVPPAEELPQDRAAEMSFLEILDATVRFGGLTALEKVSCAVEQGEIFAIVGPNGAGKSTLFNLISRFYEPESGDVRLEGESILGRTPPEIAALGIARSSQNIELFESFDGAAESADRAPHTPPGFHAVADVFRAFRQAGRDRAPGGGRAHHRFPRPSALPGEDDRGPSLRGPQGR